MVIIKPIIIIVLLGMGRLDGDQDYVYIKDTWDGDIHYLAYGDWTAVMAVWVRP